MGKISGYTGLNRPADGDLFLAVDISDTSMAPTGTDKNVTFGTMRMGKPLDGPASNQPTVWLQPDGSMVVVPESFYGLTGDDGQWINSALAKLPTITDNNYGGTYKGPWTVGTVRLWPADYKLTTGIVVPNGGTTRIKGHGPGTRLFAQSGVTAITVRGYGGGWTPGDTYAMQNHAELSGLRIDGFSAGNSAVAGIDIGGGWGHKLRDIAIVNWQGTNNIGLKIANLSAAGQNSSWTEKSRFDVDLIKNTTSVYITGGNGAANDSFEYNDFKFYCQCSAGQTGVVIDNGAFLYRSKLEIDANMGDNSGAVLTVQGNDGGVGNSSSISVCRVFIVAEHNNTVNTPQTILFGDNVHNTMNNCSGHMSFGFTSSAWTQSNATLTNFSFGGMINGDPNLISLATNGSNVPSGWA